MNLDYAFSEFGKLSPLHKERMLASSPQPLVLLPNDLPWLQYDWDLPVGSRLGRFAENWTVMENPNVTNPTSLLQTPVIDVTTGHAHSAETVWFQPISRPSRHHRYVSHKAGNRFFRSQHRSPGILISNDFQFENFQRTVPGTAAKFSYGLQTEEYLQDAHLHVPVHEEHHHYLRLILQDIQYQ